MSQDRVGRQICRQIFLTTTAIGRIPNRSRLASATPMNVGPCLFAAKYHVWPMGGQNSTLPESLALAPVSIWVGTRRGR